MRSLRRNRQRCPSDNGVQKRCGIAIEGRPILIKSPGLDSDAASQPRKQYVGRGCLWLFNRVARWRRRPAGRRRMDSSHRTWIIRELILQSRLRIALSCLELNRNRYCITFVSVPIPIRNYRSLPRNKREIEKPAHAIIQSRVYAQQSKARPPGRPLLCLFVEQ